MNSMKAAIFVTKASGGVRDTAIPDAGPLDASIGAVTKTELPDQRNQVINSFTTP
jgi:hypothetical protein